MTGAATKARQKRGGKTRAFITPEGVDLELKIASSGLRLAALAIDLAILLFSLIAFTLLMLWFGVAAGSDIFVAIWLLGFFALRSFWFIGFELGQRAATPGKRLVGIRVVARDGGRLTADAVVARNLVRELELFLPLTFMGFAAAEDAASWWTQMAGLVWSLTLSLFLLFNRDRMRMGDLIAGTWVVMAQRARLDSEIGAGTNPATDTPRFTDAELAVYGVYELQQLESVLRLRDSRAMRDVADMIRHKIGRPITGDDELFLLAYYRQLKERLEGKLLFGKRREDKYASE